MSILLALYWGPRQQSLSECVDACAETFAQLSSIGMTSLFEKGRTRKVAQENTFEPTHSALEGLLAKGVNRKDVGGSPMPELGYRLSLWSGGSEDESYSVSLRCGAYGSSSSNNLLLSLPLSGELSYQERMGEFNELLQNLGSIWGAREGVVCDDDAIEWVDGKLSKAMKSYARFPL